MRIHLQIFLLMVERAGSVDDLVLDRRNACALVYGYVQPCALDVHGTASKDVWREDIND